MTTVVVLSEESDGSNLQHVVPVFQPTKSHDLHGVCFITSCWSRSTKTSRRRRSMLNAPAPINCGDLSMHGWSAGGSQRLTQLALWSTTLPLTARSLMCALRRRMPILRRTRLHRLTASCWSFNCWLLLHPLYWVTNLHPYHIPHKTLFPTFSQYIMPFPPTICLVLDRFTLNPLLSKPSFQRLSFLITSSLQSAVTDKASILKICPWFYFYSNHWPVLPLTFLGQWNQFLCKVFTFLILLTWLACPVLKF